MNTQTQEALKMDLENLIDRFNEGWHEGIEIDASDIMLLSNIREALEQPAQEPVGQLCLGCGTSMTDARLDAEKRHNAQLISCCADRQMVDVYTHPYQWQGLTDDEINELHHKWIMNSGNKDTQYDFARAIEQALKEKNHG